MTLHYILREPVAALRFILHQNEQAVFDLLNTFGGASFNNSGGTLRCWNGGLDVELETGDWAVRVGSRVFAMTDQDFHRTFVLADQQN